MNISQECIKHTILSWYEDPNTAAELHTWTMENFTFDELEEVIRIVEM